MFSDHLVSSGSFFQSPNSAVADDRSYSEFDLTYGQTRATERPDLNLYLSLVCHVNNYIAFLQGALKVWKFPLPKLFDNEPPNGSFVKLPSNEPVNVLVRCYVIRVSHTSNAILLTRHSELAAVPSSFQYCIQFITYSQF